MSYRRSVKRWSSMGIVELIWAALSFFGLWFVSRSPRMLLFGLPAFVVLTAIPVMAISGRSATNQSQVRKTYERAAIAAAKAEDHESSELWCRKLLTLDPNNEDARFRLAVAINASGDETRAKPLFDQLAPAKGAGYPPAHFYLAGRLIEEGEQTSPEELRKAVWHLNKVLDQQPENLEAQSLLAHVQMARGDQEAAAEILEQMVVVKPELHLTLAGMYTQLGRDQTAEQHASQARLHFQHLREQDPENVSHLLRLAEAHAVSKQFREAETLLLEQRQKNLDVEAVSSELVALAILEVDLELKKEQPNWPLVVSLLERSLEVPPLYSVVFPRIALVVGRFQGEKADDLRNILEEALADGRAPAVCHLLLGTALGDAGKFDEAIQHLEAARKVHPRSPIILNNLASFLKQTKPPQLETALEHANLAVKQAPKSPEILETRGQILAALGRDEDALPDLEAALQLETVPTEVHQTLSRVYTRLGQDTLADRHRQRAEKNSK